MSDPGFIEELAAVEADLTRGHTEFIPHDEVERWLAARFDREPEG